MRWRKETEARRFPTLALARSILNEPRFARSGGGWQRFAAIVSSNSTATNSVSWQPVASGWPNGCCTGWRQTPRRPDLLQLLTPLPAPDVSAAVDSALETIRAAFVGAPRRSFACRPRRQPQACARASGGRGGGACGAAACRRGRSRNSSRGVRIRRPPRARSPAVTVLLVRVERPKGEATRQQTMALSAVDRLPSRRCSTSIALR